MAAIGQAGENLVRMSVVMNGYSHSAGGMGGVMGSKNLKAIGVKGTGSVRIAADKKAWKELVQYILSILGANNQHVVPSTPQPWAEYSRRQPLDREQGLLLGRGQPAGRDRRMRSGRPEPHGLPDREGDLWTSGPNAEKYTVRMGGCALLPDPLPRPRSMCPAVEAKYGVSRYAANTCVGWGGRASSSPSRTGRAA